MSDMQTVVYQSSAFSIINTKAGLHKLAGDFSFAEGPLWHPDGYLLLSDIVTNCIYKITPTEHPWYPEEPDGTATRARKQQQVSTYLTESGYSTDKLLYASLHSDMIGSNGLALDNEGALMICQHGNHCIARKVNNHVSPFITHFEGRPFNSPNDLVVTQSGALFFSDPPYGILGQKLHPAVFQPVAGVYQYANHHVTAILNVLHYPNGVCLSPGEEYLFVSSNHPDEPALWRLSLNKQGQATDRRLFVTVNADGIKCDAQGHLFLATNEGVLVLDEKGERIMLVKMPEPCTNLNWGGSDYKTLFVTTHHAVFSLCTYTGRTPGS